jgi:hypothetical protein
MRVLVCFAAFGPFWGAWGASLPGIQQRAGVSDVQLGLALLLVGCGALASMRLAGALFDRFGAVLTVGAVSVFGVLRSAARADALPRRALPLTRRPWGRIRGDGRRDQRQSGPAGGTLAPAAAPLGPRGVLGGRRRLEPAHRIVARSRRQPPNRSGRRGRCAARTRVESSRVDDRAADRQTRGARSPAWQTSGSRWGSSPVSRQSSGSSPVSRQSSGSSPRSARCRSAPGLAEVDAAADH